MLGVWRMRTGRGVPVPVSTRTHITQIVPIRPGTTGCTRRSVPTGCAIPGLYGWANGSASFTTSYLLLRRFLLTHQNARRQWSMQSDAARRRSREAGRRRLLHSRPRMVQPGLPPLRTLGKNGLPRHPSLRSLADCLRPPSIHVIARNSSVLCISLRLQPIVPRGSFKQRA